MFSMIHCGMIMVTTAVSTISSITTVGDAFRYRIKTPLFPIKRGLSLALVLKRRSEMIQIMFS